MKSVIASLVAAFAAVPLLAGTAAAGGPLNDRQLDSVTAGAITGQSFIFVDSFETTGFYKTNFPPNIPTSSDQYVLAFAPNVEIFVQNVVNDP